MTRRFSLEPLSVPDIQSLELVEAAAGAGFDCFSIFAYSTSPQLPVDPVVADLDLRAKVKRRMEEAGVTLSNLEFFNLTADADPADWTAALACGGELGAVSATAIVWENPDRADAIGNFRRLCDMAAEHGIVINLEFFVFCETIGNLEDAAAFVREAGHPNGKIMVDLLHLMRASGGLAALDALEPELIGGAQICDGPIPARVDADVEAMERGLPGDADFPIRAFVDRLPDNVVVGVEVPRSSEFGKVPSAQRARDLRAAVARVFE